MSFRARKSSAGYLRVTGDDTGGLSVSVDSEAHGSMFKHGSGAAQGTAQAVTFLARDSTNKGCVLGCGEYSRVGRFGI